MSKPPVLRGFDPRSQDPREASCDAEALEAAIADDPFEARWRVVQFDEGVLDFGGMDVAVHREIQPRRLRDGLIQIRGLTIHDTTGRPEDHGDPALSEAE